MPKPEKRKPDFYLSAKNMDTGRKGRCGAAWKNDDGSISIVLDPWVVLQGNGPAETTFSLVLFENKPWEKREAEAEASPAKGYSAPLDEDDIPF